jgi:hypothetical protein
MKMEEERCAKKHRKDTKNGEDQLEDLEGESKMQWTEMLGGC